MYHTAAPANRHKIKGLLLSGVIATAITGITEPIEFLFLFISPLLWLFHVIMTGLGFMVMALLGVVIGNTDGGLLDFVIFGLLQGTYTKWGGVLIVGQENIQAIDNCITRLRLVLADANKVDDDKLKQLGALGVVYLDAQNVQVIIGTKVTTVRNQLEMILG